MCIRDRIRAATPIGDTSTIALLSEQAWSFKLYTCSFQTVTLKPGLLNDKIVVNNSNDNDILLFKHDGFQSSKLVGLCVQIKLIKSNWITYRLFEERGKPEYPGKNLSEQRREPTNSTHLWCRVWKSNPGNIGGRQVLSPLRHHCSQELLRFKRQKTHVHQGSMSFLYF